MDASASPSGRLDYPFMLSPDRLGWLWFVPICFSVLVWSIGSVLACGLDLRNCVRHWSGDRPHTGDAAQLEWRLNELANQGQASVRT